MAINKAPSTSGALNIPDTSEASVLAFGTIRSGTIPTGSGDPAAGILAGYNPANSNQFDSHIRGNVSIDDYANIIAQAGTDGIRGVNYGTGTITITAEAGASISAGRYGIAAIGKQGDITITNYAAVNGGSAAINATTEAGGTVTIDNFGTLVGKIISSNVTFHNELGALWNVTGSTPFAATDTLINDGTINLQSGTLNIATSVTGAGIFTIASGSTLEFGSSVTAGMTASFMGASGTLRLDSSLTAIFSGQISGLDGTALSHDNIDLRDLAWSALVTAQYQAIGANAGILTISDGIGHTEALNLINYTGSGHFDVQDDGQGGTLVFDDEALSITGDLTVVAVKGSAVVLDATDLLAVDPSTPAGNLTYTVTQAAYHGHLLNTNTGQTLGVGATFRQADINSQYIRYVADAVYTGQLSETSGQDSFAVTLSNGVTQTAMVVNAIIEDAEFKVFKASGYDFDAEDPISRMGSGTVQNVTPSSFMIHDAIDNRDFLFTGSGFAYSGGSFSSGTISFISEVEAANHSNVMTTLGLNSVSVAAWYAAVVAAAAGNRGPIEAMTSSWNFSFVGGGGSDAFGANDFNDRFTGNSGNDTFQGDFGYDRAYYANATAAINVQLASGAVTGADVGVDTLKSIETVTGTKFDDTYNAIGFSASSINAGSTVTSNTGGLFNEFEGLGGNDQITGSGSTRVSYYHATAGVTVTFNEASWTSVTSGASGFATGDASVGNDIFTGVNAVRGSNFADVFYGSNNPSGNAENFEGLGGNDTIYGGGGFDRALYNVAYSGNGVNVQLAAGTVTGGTDIGNDTLSSVEAIWGTEFADIYNATGFTTTSTNAGSAGVNGSGVAFNEFEGGAGNDTITGNGNTRVYFGHSTSGVVVTLGVGGAGTADGSAIGHDTFASGVNAVRGSEFNDTIIGNSSNNTLEGQGGNDFLSGGGGTDRLDGGLGFDRASYADATGGLAVILAIGNVLHGGLIDTLVGIEGIVGSNFADTFSAVGFSGDSGVPGTPVGFNEFEGGAGNDTINSAVNSLGAALTRVSYVSATAGVTVDIAAGIADGNLSIGHDTFTGSGILSVWGSSSIDTIYGSNNAFGTVEVFGGFGGNDTIDGRGGFDRADYNTDPATASGITVNLATGKVIGDTTIGTDTLMSVEAVRGTNFADSYDATGFSGSSTNAGSSGTFNEFTGNGGNDTITGNGNTRLSFNNATGGVTVDIAAGMADGDASVGHDTFSGVNAIQGSMFADNLSGSGANETFTGLGGDDLIDGRGGFDTVSYNNIYLSTGGVSIDLAAGHVTGNSSIGMDSLQSIEAIQGTVLADTYTAVGYGTVGVTNVGNNGTFNQFEGLGGDDSITGNGTTRLGYFNATGGVSINMQAGSATGDASVGHDTFTGVNSVIGGNSDDSYVAAGFVGFNSFQGQGGNDSIAGNGNTQIAYNNATAAVTVDLTAGSATGDSSVGTDTFTGVNSVAGSGFNDTITGTSGDEIFIGNAGADTFIFAANLGHDTINDFATGSDKISLTFSSPFTPGSEDSFQAWATAGHVAQQGGADTLITFDAANTILIKNFTSTALHASDFIVHP